MTNLSYIFHIKLVFSNKNMSNSVNNACIDFRTDGFVKSKPLFSPLSVQDRWGYIVSTSLSSMSSLLLIPSYNYLLLLLLMLDVAGEMAVVPAAGGDPREWDSADVLFLI